MITEAVGKSTNPANYLLAQKYIQMMQELAQGDKTKTVLMPGKVIDAGNGVVEGNVIHYKFSGERLIPHPYVITATSRVTNVWAFIVTILVILLAIGSYLYKRKR